MRSTQWNSVFISASATGAVSTRSSRSIPAPWSSIANAIAARAGRRLSYVHMPVPIARNDSAYFEPLRRLALGAHTEVYLGLVHLKDGVEGARQRVSAAREHLSDFGVAAECGLGRAKTSATVTDILALHAAVCDAVSVR
jgi:hypothetical protein